MAHADIVAPEVPQLQPVTLIDCDVHASPTQAMLAEHLGPWARELLEHYGRRTPHTTDWYPRARNAGMRADAWPDKPGHVWGSDPELLRAQLLDDYDIDYAILEVLNGQDGYDHPRFMAEWNRAINDWQLQNWLEFDPRLRGCIAVAHEYPELAVTEIERRAGDARFVAVLLPGNMAESLGSPKYWPIYRAAAQAGRPLVIHTGGYYDQRATGHPSYYLEYHVGYGALAQTAVTSLVVNGVFEALPELKVVLTEAGLAWCAALRWTLDAAWERLADDGLRLPRRPSEYFDEHVWFTTQPVEEPGDPAHLLQVIEHAHLADRMLFATDYPHWDFDSPTQALPRAFGPELRRKIFAGNALDLYGLPRQRPIATGTPA